MYIRPFLGHSNLAIVSLIISISDTAHQKRTQLTDEPKSLMKYGLHCIFLINRHALCMKGILFEPLISEKIILSGSLKSRYDFIDHIHFRFRTPQKRTRFTDKPKSLMKHGLQCIFVMSRFTFCVKGIKIQPLVLEKIINFCDIRVSLNTH